MIVFGERLSPLEWTGIALHRRGLVIITLACVARRARRRAADADRTPARRRLRRRAVLQARRDLPLGAVECAARRFDRRSVFARHARHRRPRSRQARASTAALAPVRGRRRRKWIWLGALVARDRRGAARWFALQPRAVRRADDADRHDVSVAAIRRAQRDRLRRRAAQGGDRVEGDRPARMARRRRGLAREGGRRHRAARQPRRRRAGASSAAANVRRGARRRSSRRRPRSATRRRSSSATRTCVAQELRLAGRRSTRRRRALDRARAGVAQRAAPRSARPRRTRATRRSRSTTR